MAANPPTPRKDHNTNETTRRNVVGSLAALACITVLTAVMLPLRAHLSIATTALVLVVPVVVGVASGGYVAGVISVVAGFLVYDYFFIPPYLTRYVGATENWVALAVYGAVMLPVARVVAGMNLARAQARERGLQIRRLFELSTVLVEDRPLSDLLSLIVATLAEVLSAHQVALLLPAGDQLEVVAQAGAPLSDEDRRRLQPIGGHITRLNIVAGAEGRKRKIYELMRLALVASGRPVGMLVISGITMTDQLREPLLLFANQIALAVERAQLREQVLRTRLTEEVEKVARMLVAAVSHDLRGPLSSIKVSSSTLADPELSAVLDPIARQELVDVIDTQTDRLAALVSNLLDMSRVQAGVLKPRRSLTSLVDLVATVVADLPLNSPARHTEVDMPADLPPVDIDAVLIGRVLTNLLENAGRHAPPNTSIMVRAVRSGPDVITVAVTDRGPGITTNRREEIFGLFVRREADTGTGLGLAIAKTFLDAHKQRIWVEDNPGGGARFCFTLPVATSVLARH
jgi:two-component system, OmpR family, sensor histidine kinase KdpD